MFARLAYLSILIAASWLIAGCGSAAPAQQPRAATDRTTIVVSNAVVHWLAEQIAPKGARITNLTPRGTDPHDLKLTAKDRALLGHADVVLYVGGDYQPELAAALGDTKATSINVLDALKPSPDAAFWMDPIRFRGVADFAAAQLHWSSVDVDGALLELQGDMQDELRHCRSRAFTSDTPGSTFLASRFFLELGARGVAVALDPLDDTRDAQTYVERQRANARMLGAALQCAAV